MDHAEYFRFRIEMILKATVALKIMQLMQLMQIMQLPILLEICISRC